MNPAPPAVVPWELAGAACAGALVGWIVTRLAGRLVEPRRSPLVEALAVPALAAAAAGLWWWEVGMRGQLHAAAMEVPRAALAWRWAGHVVFLGFLAAATWTDLSDRVIPDSITAPGFLAGLAWSSLRPDALLPVSRADARSFAAPLLWPDALGLCGPLGGPSLPAWLGAAPALTGLGFAVVLFVAWWLSCTAPAEAAVPADAAVPAEAATRARRPFDPRLPMLAAGLAGIGAAWWHGGDHWAGMLSALVGMATGVAVVWATRIGASRALGREAVGFGDVTLVAVVGAWLGWQGTLLACCVGVLVGLAHGLVQLALARGNELPFGPSLCVGTGCVIVLWRPLWERAGPAFERPQDVGVAAAAVIALTALTLAAWWRLRGGSAA